MGAVIRFPGRRDFYDRHDRPDESICLRCFLTVQGSRWESLEEAKLEHKKLCPLAGSPAIRLPSVSRQL